MRIQNTCNHLIIEQEYGYFTPLKRSRCCIYNDQKHSGCYCEKELSSCKLICDEDPYCKGYTSEGDTVCQISTGSSCPLGCESFAESHVSSLDRNAVCGSGDGCFMKKSGTQWKGK